jgi:hypothetical protein
MPGFDGTGPQGRGPMTGRGMGFCVLKESKGEPGSKEGFAGIQGVPVSRYDYGLPYVGVQVQPMYSRAFGRRFGCGRRFRGGRGGFGW